MLSDKGQKHAVMLLSNINFIILPESNVDNIYSNECIVRFLWQAQLSVEYAFIVVHAIPVVANWNFYISSKISNSNVIIRW